MNRNIKVGILAFQGDIEEHEATLASMGKQSIRVKSKQDLEGVTHLIFPGGESTVIGKFLHSTGLDEEILKKVKAKELSIYGTCAGAILLAREVESPCSINNLNLIDAKISRNAYGSQIHSFEADLSFLPLQKKIKAVFIRAPKILAYAPEAEVLCRHGDEVVMLRQENVLLSTFHPELTTPPVVHTYFLEKV